MLSALCGVQACWWVVVTICCSRVKALPFPRGLRVAVLGESCVVVWQGAVERLSEFVWKGRAAADAEEPVLGSSCAKATALPQKEADRSLLWHGQHIEASTTTLSFARCRSQAWIQRALRGCSDLHKLTNSGTMFTLSFPMSAYKQRPRIIKTMLILLYSAWKPDVKQENIKFLRDSIRWVTLL